MDKLFLIDLDDTLIFTQCHYNRAQEEFLYFSLDSFKNFGVSFDDINRIQDGKQSLLMDKFGRDTETYAQSLKDAYVEIGERYGMSSKEIRSGAHHVYKIGKTVFDEKKWKSAGLYPGVRGVLEFLVNNGDELALVTLGDVEMQNRKVEVMGLERWFSDNIHVDLKEKSSIINKLSFGKNKDSIYFVGNSYNSDIRPALDVGIRAVYIPQDTWSRDGYPEKNDDRMITLRSMMDLKKIYYHGLK